MGGHALNRYTRYRTRMPTWNVVQFNDPEELPAGVEYDKVLGLYFLHTPSGRSEVVPGRHYIVTDMMGTRYTVQGDVWDATHEEYHE